MNLKYLGDGLDHFKGAVIRALVASSAVRELHVAPMLTDSTKWLGEHWSLYAGLLGQSVTSMSLEPDVAEWHSLFPANRDRYFADLVRLRGRCDFFLDPDTGIGKHKEHVRLRDLVLMLHPPSDRLVLTYQHAWRNTTKDGQHRLARDVEEWAQRLLPLGDDVVCGVFHGGSAALVQLGRSVERVAAALNSLATLAASPSEDHAPPQRVFGPARLAALVRGGVAAE